MAARFVADFELADYDAAMVTQSPAFARYFEAAVAALLTANPGKLIGAEPRVVYPKLVANWLMGEVSRRLNADSVLVDDSPVDAQTLAALIGRVVDGTISNNAARSVFDRLWAGDASAARVDALITELGLRQMDDSSALAALVDEVIANNPKSVDEFRAGKERAFNALVGQVMKASKGKANPTQVNELLRSRLDQR
jgi:aspartyl-tRNA(Asn)/glutamyl-tRNA(Gln) amidotransferase subunit B